MFSQQIVDSDAFLDMPQSSQLLYFHLGMRADDCGFIGNYKKVMRVLGTSDDDFKILVVKRFVLVFPSGVVVIKHWLIHNSVRVDRFTPTVYKEEYDSLFIKENKAYSDTAGNGIPVGNQLTTTGMRNLTKLNLTKLNIHSSAEGLAFDEFWSLYPKKNEKKKSQLKWGKLPPPIQKLVLEDIPRRKEGRKWREGFIENPAAYLNGERWNDEIEASGETSSPRTLGPDEMVLRDRTGKIVGITKKELAK